MKIAFYHELHKGGARRGTNEFAKQLKNRGNLVDLYTIDPIIKEEKEFYVNRYSYKFIPKKWMGRNPRVRLYKDTIELFKLFILNRKIAKDINRRKYDLVYVTASQFIESPFILNFINSPTFFYCNDPYYRIIYEPELFKTKNLNFFKIKYEQVNRIIRKNLDRWNISKANYIISISKFTRYMFAKVYGKKGDVVYCGVDTTHFVPKNLSKEYDLLFIGSYDFLDGYSFFQEVVGEMKSNPKTRTIIFEDEWLSDKELLETYNKSRIFVSVSYREPLGLVPMEVMCCGIPVVAVDEAGHKETIINNKTGYLLKRDAKLFAKKIDYLLNHNEILMQMGRNARRIMVEKWDWSVKGKELENYLFEKVKQHKNKTIRQ